MSERLPELPTRGRTLDARLHLLDQSIQDVDGRPAAFVADLELTRVGDDLVVEHLIAGSGLIKRLFGGRPPPELLHRFRWQDVAEVGTRVVLGVSARDHTVLWPERWVRDNVIRLIPGGRHDPQ